jgi:hypothetical protein
MSEILNSIETELAASRVSVSRSGKLLRLKSGEACTRTFFSSREALGKCLRKESLIEPKSSCVEMLLLSDFMRTVATLSWKKNEAVKRTTENEIIRMKVTFKNRSGALILFL